jgi:hypothetical protein
VIDLSNDANSISSSDHLFFVLAFSEIIYSLMGVIIGLTVALITAFGLVLSIGRARSRRLVRLSVALASSGLGVLLVTLGAHWLLSGLNDLATMNLSDAATEPAYPAWLLGLIVFTWLVCTWVADSTLKRALDSYQGSEG